MCSNSLPTMTESVVMPAVAVWQCSQLFFKLVVLRCGLSCGHGCSNRQSHVFSHFVSSKYKCEGSPHAVGAPQNT